MSSLFGAYVKELKGRSIVESDKGFATYFFLNDICYIEDIYTHPDHRHDHTASKMAEEIEDIARKNGAKRLCGTVIPSNNNSTASLRVMLSYGFQLDSAAQNLIVFTKEL